MPKVKFFSGVQTVTGANFQLNFDDKNILIDCGLIQGEKVVEQKNRDPFEFDPHSISHLFVTHAHLDHVGRIPKLVKEGFTGEIISTPETKMLAELVLNDAVYILDNEARQEGVLPLYDAEDLKQVFPLWKTVQYHEEYTVSDHIKVKFKDAGHILGSSMINFEVIEDVKKQNILFSGDLGNSPSPLLRDTEESGDIDYLVVESTYGDRNHSPKEQREKKLENIINETINKGGTLIIPAFCIDRTQVFLYEINNLIENNKIKSVPVYIDSPMAIRATEIYKKSINLFNETVKSQSERGDDIFNFSNLHFCMTASESREIHKKTGPKIILAGSGMSVGGRIINHEEMYLPDPNNTLLLVGYQSAGSLGRQIADGIKKVEINRKRVHIRAKIETLYDFSAHKDKNGILNFIGNSKKLKKIFVVMGELKSALHLSQAIRDEFGIEAVLPEVGKEYELI